MYFLLIGKSKRDPPLGVDVWNLLLLIALKQGRDVQSFYHGGKGGVDSKGKKGINKQALCGSTYKTKREEVVYKVYTKYLLFF
jgi:hypothetical protein